MSGLAFNGSSSRRRPIQARMEQAQAGGKKLVTGASAAAHGHRHATARATWSMVQIDPQAVRSERVACSKTSGA